MYPQFLTYIKEKALFRAEEPILLAVSGGVDSMVMLHLCHLAGFEIGVAHVNFGLRGEHSDADEELVRQWCLDHDVQFHLHGVRPEDYKSDLSTQMNARTIRYDFFDSIMSERRYSKLATAHNQNDSLETVILNLTKGTGIAGLTGISPIKGELIRPLLFATKQEVYSYAKAERLAWREDASNQKSDYQRNLIRNEVLPLLQKINPSFITNFHFTQERIQGAREALSALVEEKRERIEEKNKGAIINVDWYRNDNKSLVILGELIKDYGYRYHDTKDIGRAISQGHSGKVFLSSKFELLLDRDRLIIQTLGESVPLVPVTLELNKSVTFGDFEFRIEQAEGSDLPKVHSGNIGYFDADKVVFPLIVRSFREGDVFWPLGLQGRKKLSDFFIDQKVALHRKPQVPVVESAGEIIWVAGYRLDDRFKIEEPTKKMIRIEMTNL